MKIVAGFDDGVLGDVLRRICWKHYLVSLLMLSSFFCNDQIANILDFPDHILLSHIL